jgi:cation transport ATPase
MTLPGMIPAAGVDAATVLRTTGAADAVSEHPIAKAIAHAPCNG